MIIKPKFDVVGEFSGGQVWVDNSYGSFLMDKKKKEKILVSLTYDDVEFFSEGLRGVEKDGKDGFIE